MVVIKNKIIHELKVVEYNDLEDKFFRLQTTYSEIEKKRDVKFKFNHYQNKKVYRKNRFFKKILGFVKSHQDH